MGCQAHPVICREVAWTGSRDPIQAYRSIAALVDDDAAARRYARTLPPPARTLTLIFIESPPFVYSYKARKTHTANKKGEIAATTKSRSIPQSWFRVGCPD